MHYLSIRRKLQNAKDAQRCGEDADWVNRHRDTERMRR